MIPQNGVSVQAQQNMGKEPVTTREGGAGSTLQDKIAEIWKEPPRINFPQCLIEKLDLHKFHLEMQGKAERLKERIM